MKYVCLLPFVCFIWTVAQAQSGTATRYVSTTGTTAPSGAISWATSTTDLQGAINAVSAGGGGYVYVAQGIYNPGGTTNTNRSISFSMANSVTIVGGYVGSGSPGASIPLSSTLSGEIGNVSSTTDNSYHVINNPPSLSLSASAVLADLVVTGGNANVNSYPESAGGGMYNDATGSMCSPTIRNCLFINNLANNGAAVLNNADLAGVNKANFINCSFVNNRAVSSVAGAIWNKASDRGDCSPQLINCSFTGNQARFGGGVYNSGSNATCSPTLLNCAFTNNQSVQTGGALYNDGNSGRCIPNLINCSFVNNRSQNGFAGAIWNDGRNGACLTTLTNCTLRDNTASQQAAAMYNTGGGGSCIVVLTNCILWDNGGNSIRNDDASVSASYSLLQDYVGVGAGLSNIVTGDSPFINTTTIQLNSCSRAINAGNPASTTAISAPYSATNLPTTDLGGNSRLVGKLVDIGAYEFQGLPDTPTAFTQQPISGSVSCLGSSVSIPVSVSGVAPYYYQWYKDGVALTAIESATTGTLTLTDLALTDSGSYSVIASGACNSVRSTVFSLTVTPRATLTVSNSGTLTCAVPTLTLTAGGGISYAFDQVGGGNGLISQNAASGRAEVNASGAYSVTVTDSYGCSAVLSTTILSETAISAVSLTPSGTITCANTTVILTASPTGSYTYTFSGGAAQIGSGNTATVQAGGSYSVAVRYPDGCAVTTSTTVSQNTVTPGIALSATNGGVITCSQPLLTLTAFGPSGATSLTYTFTGPGLSQSGLNTTAPVNTSGTYSVTVTGANGCTATSSTLISQNTAPPVASITPASATLNCASPTISLTALGGGDYQWEDNTLLATRTVSASGVYSVTVTGANGCTATTSAIISSKPGDDFVLLSPTVAGSAVCAGNVVTVAVSTTGTGVRYRWYRNGVSVSGQTSATLTLNAQPGDAGEYIVVATGACNSVTSSAFSLAVTPRPSPTILFSPTTTPSVLLNVTGGFTTASPELWLLLTDTRFGRRTRMAAGSLRQKRGRPTSSGFSGQTVAIRS